MKTTPTISPRPAAQPAEDVTSDAPSAPAEAPGQVSTLAIAEDDQDAVRGLQLDMQWAKAVRGEAEQHIFGAMMILLDEYLKSDSTRGIASNYHKMGRGGNKGTGRKAWLKAHAPAVKESTACRYMKATQGLMKKVGIADAPALQRLLECDREDLAAPEQAKQLELFTLLEGCSQNDLLTPAESKLAAAKHRRLTPAQARELLHSVALDVMEKVRFFHDRKAYVPLNPAELDGAIDHLREALRDAEAWRKMTQPERDAALAEQVRAQIKEARA